MRVLLVEDEVDLAELIAAGLSAAGFTVDVVHDGAEGLWRAREFSYAAIVLDLLLPGMNGFAVCRELRGTDLATPVLILTAKTGEYDEAEALDTGADDFLSKPFSFVVLVARLRALIRRGAQPIREAVHMGTLTLDPATRSCRRGDVPIELTPREYAVIEALMRRDGAVTSKLELLDEVWGPDTAADVNIVEVYVGYLRNKVDRPFGVDTVVTVRGCGYRLIPDA